MVNCTAITSVSKHQSCKTCSYFLRVKFKVFNLPQNMAFSNSNIYKFKNLQNLKSSSYRLIPVSYWPVFGINQLVDSIVRLTFVLTEFSTTKPSSLTSHMVNLPHGWYPRTPQLLCSSAKHNLHISIRTPIHYVKWVMVVNMPLNKRVFQKCLEFSKTWKSRYKKYVQNGELKFEHKKYSVNIPFQFRNMM